MLLVVSEVALYSGGRRTISTAPDEVRIERILSRGEVARNPIVIGRAQVPFVLDAIAKARAHRGRGPLGYLDREDGSRWAVVAPRNRAPEAGPAVLLLLEDADREPVPGKACIEGAELDALERACRAVLEGHT